MSSSVNYSNINSILTRLDHFDDDFMIVEEKNQNLSMHISSYMGSEIQEIHDGSNIKLNDINEQFNSLNMYSKKEQVLDKSLSFQNICVEDKFFNKEVMDSNLGKDNWIDPIAEDGDEDVNESFFHENNYFIDKFCQKPNCFDTNTINNNLNSNNNNIIYRDNKLINILKECFGGNCYTNIILTCSKHEKSAIETKNTLNFGEKIKKGRGKKNRRIKEKRRSHQKM